MYGNELRTAQHNKALDDQYVLSCLASLFGRYLRQKQRPKMLCALLFQGIQRTETLDDQYVISCLVLPMRFISSSEMTSENGPFSYFNSSSVYLLKCSSDSSNAHVYTIWITYREAYREPLRCPMPLIFSLEMSSENQKPKYTSDLPIYIQKITLHVHAKCIFRI